MPKNPTHCKICGQLREPAGCNARGMCSKCYYRWRVNGDPRYSQKRRFSPEEDLLLLALIDDTPLGIGSAARGTLAEVAIRIGRSAGSCTKRLSRLQTKRRAQLRPDQLLGLEDARFLNRGRNG